MERFVDGLPKKPNHWMDSPESDKLVARVDELLELAHTIGRKKGFRARCHALEYMRRRVQAGLDSVKIKEGENPPK